MLLIILVFGGVFGIVACSMLAMRLGPSRKEQQINSALESALATETVTPAEILVDFRKGTILSSIPWLNRRLLQFDLASSLQAILRQANLNWSAGKLLLFSFAGLAIPCYLVQFLLHSPALAIAAGVLLGIAPLCWVLFKRRQRFRRIEQQLPDALDLMVSALRAGHSLIAAMGLIARECPDPIGGEFRTCFDEQNYGLELKAAIDNLLVRVPSQDIRVFTSVIVIQKESGGNLAEVLDKTAYSVRERFRLRRQVMVHTAQGRLTGIILTFMPVGLGIALYLANPTMVSVLWTRPLGVKLLWASSGLTLIGGLIINKIVNMDV